jgi:acetoin:2,6-dichlorophenolindophenol oxidoreductase subunit alpha
MLTDLKWELYRQMKSIRRVEETLLDLFDEGKLHGTVHTCIGQEACAVGIINALDQQKDIIWSNHRGHGHYLAYSDDIEGLMAEIMGRANGVCGGVGGSQHLHRDGFYTNGVLGGTVACAVGTALAEKHKESRAITTVFFGDGALGEGVIYESFNLASLWNLPVLFVLEHNRYAQSTPSHQEHAGNLALRAAPFEIESKELHANDVMVVAQVAAEAAQKVRQQQRPFFLVLHTERFAPHSKGDDFRPPEEMAERRKEDPLKRLRSTLAEINIQQLEALEASIEQRITKSIESAQDCPPMTADAFIQKARS